MKMKKISIFLILIILITYILPIPQALAANTVKVYVYGTYGSSRGTAVLREINKNRLTGNLVIDQTLIGLAQLRAKEISIEFSHTRPNIGGNTYSYGGVTYREYISKGSIDTSEAGNPELYKDYMRTNTYAFGFGSFSTKTAYFEVVLLADKVQNKVQDISVFSTTDTVEITTMPEYLNFAPEKSVINANVGDTLDIKIKQGDVILENQSFTWTSSDYSVAWIYNKTVRATAPGTAIITAFIGDKEAKIQVNVKAPLKGITLSDSKLTINNGEQSKLNVTLNPENTTDSKIVTWKSDNPEIASVDNEGNITANSIGKTNITATVGSYSKTCEVTVIQPVQNVQFIEKNITIKKENKKQLEIMASSDNDEYKERCVYKSSNENIVTVDSNGEISAISAGDAVISVLVDGQEATCNVKVVVPLESIAFDYEYVTLRQKNVQQLKVYYTPEDTTDSKDITWLTEDEDVVTVDDNGLVTARNEGTAKIIAKCNGKQAECSFNVNEIKLQSISFSQDNYVLQIGDIAKLEVNYYPTTTTNDKTVIWSTNNEKIVTVDGDGNIKAVGPGQAVITARVKDKVIYCDIEVQSKLKSISLNKNSLELLKNDSTNLKVTYNPENTTDNKEVTWSSSDSTIATVDGNGKVVGNKAGTAIIYAKVTNKIATCEVTVKEIPLESIEFENKSIEIKKGEAKELKLTVNPQNTTDDYEILWLSQNEKIARVDNGIVTGVDVGETIIVATTGNKITSCTVKIIDDNSQIIEPEKPETQITNPSKVKNVKAKVQDANSVTITWNSVPEEITGYKVFKYNPETNTCEFIGKTKNTEYTISNLKDGTEYSFRVRAYKTVDSVQYVGKLSGELKTATKPIKEKIANITTKNQKVTITWKETTGTGYEIYMATEENGEYVKIKTIKEQGITQYTKKGLEKGKIYYFKVRAYKYVPDVKIKGPFSRVRSIAVK